MGIFCVLLNSDFPGIHPYYVCTEHTTKWMECMDGTH